MSAHTCSRSLGSSWVGVVSGEIQVPSGWIPAARSRRGAEVEKGPCAVVPQNSNIAITWNFLVMQNLGPHPQTSWSRNSGGWPSLPWLTGLQVILTLTQVWETLDKENQSLWAVAPFRMKDLFFWSRSPPIRVVCAAPSPCIQVCCCCSVTPLCPTPWDPRGRSTPGFPVPHHLLEFAQVHVHWIGGAIQPSHPLSNPSPALSLSQHEGLFQWVDSSYQVAKVLELQLQSFQWVFRVDFLYGWLVWSPCCPRSSQKSSPAPQLESTRANWLQTQGKRQYSSEVPLGSHHQLTAVGQGEDTYLLPYRLSPWPDFKAGSSELLFN